MSEARVAFAQLPAQCFPFRMTFLRHGVVLYTTVVEGVGALLVPELGPCTTLFEFADGTCYIGDVKPRGDDAETGGQ